MARWSTTSRTIEGEFAAAIVFDGHMVDAHRPAITTGLRGLVGFQLHVRSGERELHSGLYGGAAANAVHDLTTILNAVIGKESEFADGAAPVSAEERAGWAELPSGAELLAEAGATTARRPGRRGGLRAHLGAAVADRALGRCRRSDHHQDVDLGRGPGLADAATGARAGARADVRAAAAAAAGGLPGRTPRSSSIPGRWRVPPTSTPTGRCSRQPSARSSSATGVRPLAVRSGGSIPIGAALVARGIPTILSGFGAAEDNIHSPNEGMELRRLEWALGSARELYLALGG